MIDFFFEEVTPIENPNKTQAWLENIILNEGKKVGDISYIFCNDAYLLDINITYLQHDYYTDIITFDYCKAKTISGDIFVSLQRVADNAKQLNIPYEKEQNRVLAHGILHLCGYKDKSEQEQLQMRAKEEEYLAKFT